MIYRYEVGYYPDAQNFKIDVYSDVAKAANAILSSIKETKNKYFLYEVQYEDKEHLAKSEPKSLIQYGTVHFSGGKTY